MQPGTLLDLFYLAYNHECRSIEEQAAMEAVAAKLDFNEATGTRDGSHREAARESCKPCERHRDGEHAPEGGLPA